MNTDRQPSPDVISAIEGIIRTIGRISPTDARFTTSVELFDSGYIESLGIVQLTAELEETFGVTFSEQDLFDPRFSTVIGIAYVVHDRRAALSNPPSG